MAEVAEMEAGEKREKEENLLRDDGERDDDGEKGMMMDYCPG